MTIGVAPTRVHARRPTQSCRAPMTRPERRRGRQRAGCLRGAASINPQPVDGKVAGHRFPGRCTPHGARADVDARCQASAGPPRTLAGHLISHILKGVRRWQIPP